MIFSSISSTISLNNRVRLPLLGFGTYKLLPGNETISAVLAAFNAGYRLIDTAWFYENEASVGEAIRLSGLPRSEIFVTTKIWSDSHGYDRALASCAKSLEQLGTDYIDLYLIHWPSTSLIAETWRAFERLYADGYCRAIGVSNFTTDQLDNLLKGCSVAAALNQVELHPFLAQRDLRTWCAAKGITVQAYRSLLRGGPRDHSVITEIALIHRKSPAQILIKWALQQNIPVIPKSASALRIAQNAEIFDFELSGESMDLIGGLDEGLHLGPDPADSDSFSHL